METKTRSLREIMKVRGHSYDHSIESDGGPWSEGDQLEFEEKLRERLSDQYATLVHEYDTPDKPSEKSRELYRAATEVLEELAEQPVHKMVIEYHYFSRLDERESTGFDYIKRLERAVELAGMAGLKDKMMELAEKVILVLELEPDGPYRASYFCERRGLYSRAIDLLEKKGDFGFAMRKAKEYGLSERIPDLCKKQLDDLETVEEYFCQKGAAYLAKKLGLDEKAKELAKRAISLCSYEGFEDELVELAEVCGIEYTPSKK